MSSSGVVVAVSGLGGDVAGVPGGVVVLACGGVCAW